MAEFTVIRRQHGAMTLKLDRRAAMLVTAGLRASLMVGGPWKNEVQKELAEILLDMEDALTVYAEDQES